MCCSSCILMEYKTVCTFFLKNISVPLGTNMYLFMYRHKIVSIKNGTGGCTGGATWQMVHNKQAFTFKTFYIYQNVFISNYFIQIIVYTIEKFFCSFLLMGFSQKKRDLLLFFLRAVVSLLLHKLHFTCA